MKYSTETREEGALLDQGFRELMARGQSSMVVEGRGRRSRAEVRYIRQEQGVHRPQRHGPSDSLLPNSQLLSLVSSQQCGSWVDSSADQVRALVI